MVVTPASAENSGDWLAAPRVIYAIVLTPGEKIGSSEDQVILLSKALEQAGGIGLALFCTASESARVDDFTSRGVRSETLNLFKFDTRALKKLLAIIDDNRIDAIHWNMFHPLLNPYLWVLSVMRPRLRHLYTDHISRFTGAKRGRSRLSNRVAPALWTRYAGVHCVSEFVRGELVERTGIRHAVTVPHFINTARFRPDAASRSAMRAKLGLTDEFTLLFVGYLIWEKGVDVAIRALAEMSGRPHLLIAGSGPEEGPLRKLANELGVGDRTHFLGHVRQTDGYFHASDVLVCPSRWKEAAGFVNLEAQAAGLPVVGSRIGGIPEYVIDGQTGYLCEPGNADALMQKLEALQGDRPLTKRLGRQAEAHAREEFSPERGTARMLAWYRSALGRLPSAGTRAAAGARPHAAVGTK